MISSKIITSKNIFNCSDLGAFLETVVQRMPYVGASDSRFYLCEIDGVQFLTKMSLKSKTAREIHRPNTPSTGKYIANIDAEIQILTIFKHNLITTNTTPHIIELIYHKKCSTSTIIKEQECMDQGARISLRTSISDDIIRDICKHQALVLSNLAYPELVWMVLEHGNISLANLMERSYISPINTVVIKTILFHIIYTFCAIKSKYPRFRHNDLHGENIVLVINSAYNFDEWPRDLYICKHLNKQFAVPYFGIITKIIDFGNSELPEHNIISQSAGNEVVMYDRVSNDMILLFHWVYVHMVLRHGSDDLDRMLKILEPNQTYIKFDTMRIRQIADKIPSYEKMLLSDAFANYQVDDISGQKFRKCYTIS